MDRTFFKDFGGPLATVVAAAAAVVVTAIFGMVQARIARSQLRIADAQKYIAAARFNFDLYSKRYEVFEAMRTLVRYAITESKISVEQLAEFDFKTASAAFLFGDEVVDFRREIRSKVLTMKEYYELYLVHSDEPLKQQEIASIIADLRLELEKTLPIIVATFQSYLKFGNINPPMESK